MRRRFSGVLIVTLVLFLVGCMGPGETSLHSEELETNQYFSLNNLQGEEVILSAVLKENKAVLINFWATWCPPCREEIPGLISLQKAHGDNGFTVLGVDAGESERKVKPFVEKMNINYPVLLDKDMSVADVYHVVGIPTSFLVNSDGKVLGEYHSYSKKLIEDVENALK